MTFSPHPQFYCAYFQKYNNFFCLLLICLAILALIDDDLVVQVDLLHRFMGYRKLLVAKIFLLHVSVLSLLQIVHLFLSLNLRSQLFFGGKKSEIFRREKVIVVVQNGEARDVIVGVGA